MISRKRVHQESQQTFHLDLFSPAEAHFEDPAVTTNKALSGPALWDAITGGDTQEKPLGERKGECALDVAPTHDSGANSASPQLSLLAQNLMRSFQVQTLALPTPRSGQRTSASPCAASGLSAYCAVRNLNDSPDPTAQSGGRVRGGAAARPSR